MSAFGKQELESIRVFFDALNKGHHSDNWKGKKASHWQQELILAIDQDKLEDSEAYRLAYWALSKRFDPNLVTPFRRWLKRELEGADGQAIFQLMIGLDNLDEPVFDPSRSGYASFEEELNRRDASHYLNHTHL